MLPPIFQTLTSSSLITDIVGTKVFPYGDAPQDITRPYVTWHIVSGVPQNSLSEVPDIDNISIQVDCWHPVAAGLEELATAVRNRIEPYAHMTNIPLNDRDRETRLYRMTLQFDWWLNRDYLPPPIVEIDDGPVEVTYTTAEALGGNRIVYIDTDNFVHYASNDDLGITNVTLGVTKHAAAAGQPIVVQISGEMVNPGWAFNKKVPLFLGKNGMFTEAVPSYPSSLVSLIAAFTVDADRIIIRFREPIVLI